MNAFTFSPDDVVLSHQESMESRQVTSVVPEVTAVDIDPARLLDVASRLGMGDFHREGVITEGPRNLLKGVGFHYINGLVSIDRIPDSAGADKTAAIEELVDDISRIDAHFRDWYGLADDVQTKPLVNMFAGKFSGKKISDTNPHFDFQARAPMVSYKSYFAGDPRFASVYYPGQYRLPTRLTRFSRAVSGLPEPNYPKPMFKKRQGTTHVMPAEVVCVEPWNAYHGGPKDKEARGTQRGLISVAYNLENLPPPSR